MSYYLTLRNDSAVKNSVSVSAFKYSGYETTSVDKIYDTYVMQSASNDKPAHLQADIAKFIKRELKKIDLSVCKNAAEAEAYILGEADFLEQILDSLDIDISEHPYLRDYQHKYIRDCFTNI